MKTFTCIDMQGVGGRKINVECDGKFVACFRPASQRGAYAWQTFVSGVAAQGDKLTLQTAGEPELVLAGTVEELDDALIDSDI